MLETRKPVHLSITLDDQLSLMNWGAMRLNLYWAYDGVPFSSYSTMTVTSQTAWLLRKGAVQVHWRGREMNIRSGQWIVLGGDRGRHQFSEDAALVSVCFRAEWFTGQAFFDDSEPIVFDAASCPSLERAAASLVRVSHRLSHDNETSLIHESCTFVDFLQLRRAYLTWLEGLTLQMKRVGVGLRRVGPTDERVLHGVRLIDDWPMQRPLDEKEIASTVGLSRAHFSRLLTVEFGLSPKAYFERRRYQAARERLLADDTPIKTIAYQLGFHDTAHFSNWFRQRSGTSPSGFRAGHANPWNLA